MAEIIVVTSGKGGVGKTTTSASLACGLAKRGKKVAVIDFDVGLRNLDLIMGCERRVVYDFVNVVHGEATLKQSLIKDKRFENLYVLAASQTRDKDALTQEGVEKVLKDLAADGFDYIVCDSPAGIEKGAFLAMYFADRAVVVVNPEVSSVRDSDRIIGLLDSKTRKAEEGKAVPAFLLLTRYSPGRVEGGEMLSITDVEEVLGLKAIGVIPESGDVLNASNKGEPVILDAESPAGQAYDDAVARIMGEGARCDSHPWRRKASSASCSEGKHGPARFSQEQEEHRRDGQEPPADHHCAGAQPPRRAGLPTADAARVAGSDQEICQHRCRCGPCGSGQGWRTRRAGYFGRPTGRRRQVAPTTAPRSHGAVVACDPTASHCA